MVGWEVAKRAREIDPEFPIVYMTGASADDYGSLGVPNSILLTKPFAPAQLVPAVSQLLNAGSRRREACLTEQMFLMQQLTCSVGV